MKLKRRSPGRPPRATDSVITAPVVDLRRLLEGLEREGTTVMELASTGRTPDPWTIYPGESGIFDRTTGYQVYYHRHEPGAAEAGHFHTVRLFPDRVAHLVAISMAPDGWPQALFTVNLWAVGDADESVENLRRYAQAFHIDERRFEVDRGVSRDRLTPVVRFANLVFRAFAAAIDALQRAKIRTFEDYRERHPAADPFTDRSLEILSRIEINLRGPTVPGLP